MALKVQGIDVSKYQGDINFTKVKASGIKFVIIRAGWGKNNIDGKFKRNADECTRLGIPFGVYWFSYALNPNDAKQEANACLSLIKGYKLQYPVCFDYEYDSVSYSVKKGVNVTKESASAIAKAFLSTVEAAGYWATNYTNLDFSKRYFDDYIMKKYDIWAARYTSSAKDIAVGAGLWQYSSTGKVNGIVGNVDMDYAQKDYPALIAKKNNNPKTNSSSATTVPGADVYKIPSAYDPIFNADFYINKYPDLKAYINQLVAAKMIANTKEAIAWQLYQHFLMSGMNEHRQAFAEFDVVKYRNAQTDLNQLFGDEWPAYYLHYITAGKAEIAAGKRKPF